MWEDSVVSSFIQIVYEGVGLIQIYLDTNMAVY